MSLGLRTYPAGGAAAPPYSNGPYKWTLDTSKADTKLLEFSFTNSAATGDNRGIYNRFYLTGSGAGGGESWRTFTTVNGALGTAHGAHCSLSFGASGSLSGLGVAVRSTLHIPDNASWTGGTMAAVMAEIYSDGAASDPDGLTEVSFFRVVNAGDSTGAADIDTDAVLFSLQGFTANTGSLVEVGTGMGTVTGTFKCKLGTGLVYIPYYSAPG